LGGLGGFSRLGGFGQRKVLKEETQDYSYKVFSTRIKEGSLGKRKVGGKHSLLKRDLDNWVIFTFLFWLNQTELLYWVTNFPYLRTILIRIRKEGFLKKKLFYWDLLGYCQTL